MVATVNMPGRIVLENPTDAQIAEVEQAQRCAGLPEAWEYIRMDHYWPDGRHQVVLFFHTASTDWMRNVANIINSDA